MHILGLTELQHHQIGDENVRGISGGQRKRVNVGIEVVSNPQILFLDEPTSGLDSSGSMEMLHALRTLAKERSLTIAAVIHQPSWQLAQKFDAFMILSKGGKTAFLGPTNEMQPYFESLGFAFPPGWNPVDVVLDCVSGVIPSSRPGITHQSLPSLWKEHTSGVREGGSLQELQSAADKLQEVVDKPPEQVLPEDEGTLGGGLLMFLLSLIFPPLVLVPFYWFRTRRNQYSACLGFGLGTFWYYFFPTLFLPATPDSPGNVTGVWIFIVGLTVVSYQALIGFITLFVLLHHFRKTHPICIWGHFAVGSWLGPLALPLVFFMREKSVFAVLLGAGINLFILGASMATISEIVFENVPMSSSFAVLFCGTGIVFISVSRSRWNRVASSERKTAGLLRQSVLQFWRSLTQASRDMFGFAFDCVLPLFSGLSVGVLFLQKAWVPPLAEVSEQAYNITRCFRCDLALSANFDPNLVPICRWMLLGKFFFFFSLSPFFSPLLFALRIIPLSANDPFPSLSLMACMGLGLVGAASALRVFGLNRANFLREKSSGIMTEGFFVGRSVAHLLFSALATFFFTVAFYAFIRPHGPFWPFFLMFYLVYQTCAGVAMTWSIALDGNLAGLMSLLTVLTFVLFGGSLFIGGVWMPSPMLDPLQFSLWVPSILSPLRFSYELCYLLLIDPFIPYMRDDTLTYAFVNYGFQPYHGPLCWTSLALLVYLYRIVLPYAALVLRERKD